MTLRPDDLMTQAMWDDLKRDDEPNAYAEAMAAKIEDLFECIERHLNEVGLTMAPRVVGQFCPWPRPHGAIEVIADPNLKPGQRFFINAGKVTPF